MTPEEIAANPGKTCKNPFGLSSIAVVTEKPSTVISIGSIDPIISSQLNFIARLQEMAKKDDLSISDAIAIGSAIDQAVATLYNLLSVVNG